MVETKITEKQVKKIAQLCNLVIDAADLEKFAKMFTDTLDYINVLEELDTSSTKETYQVTGLTNVFMKDGENVATLSKEDALKNASEVVRGLFATKAVFDRE